MAQNKVWTRYLIWFAHEHVAFRNFEMQSILSMYNIPIKFIEIPNVNKPYWIVELPSEECAKQIASRSILLKSCVELWAKANLESQLHLILKKSLKNSSFNWLEDEALRKLLNSEDETHLCPSHLIYAYSSPEHSFKIDVETFCKHFSMKEKINKIEKFSYLPLQGPVRLKNPDVTLAYMEFYGVDPNNVPDTPYSVFFGRWVCSGQRQVLKAHSLKRRAFIGNTSMDAALALLMANAARVRSGDLVLDPFVGSGSLLVAAAHFGAYVWGSDIDYLMLHARSRPTRVGHKKRDADESISGNLQSYGSGARYLDVLVADAALPLWHPRLQLDAILTDPPYGVREGAARVGIDRAGYTLSEEHLVHHVPAKVEYALPQLYADLLTFAARHLRPGARLVLWYPVIREEYRPEMAPRHPSLELVFDGEQVLSRAAARRMLVYQRREHVDPAPCPASTPQHPADKPFREKYFSYGEETRRERAARRAHHKSDT